MKIAIIQDWLTTIGGSENVVKTIHSLYPDSDIYTLVALDETIKKLGFKREKVHTSIIQTLPFGKKKYRSFLPIFPLVIEQFDLSKYDLIISSSHAVAKGVLTNSSQVHICYCHSPIRYAWDLHHQYLKESKLDRGLKGFLARFFLHKIRIWDVISSNRVDYFISNSNYIGRRIKRIYNRESITIYPNVDVNSFNLLEEKEYFYFTCSRFVPYKKIDIIVEAFASMPDKKLYVIGDGPDFEKVKKIASNNVTLLGHQPFDVLLSYYQRAKGFIFAAEEDFGIVPVEAQACGTPVIAFKKGGALETVLDGETGVFFEEQTASSLISAVKRFETYTFDSKRIRLNAERFSTERFSSEFKLFVDRAIKDLEINGSL